MPDSASVYVGRFAPSPTGPLHFGSLLAAVASYLEARRAGGEWLVRIEDIDPPREQPGASDRILTCLEACGFEWDRQVIFQSSSAKHHDRAVDWLLERGLAYRCNCSRRDLADEPAGPLGTIYPGTCRNRRVEGESAIRVRTHNRAITVNDRLQGRIEQRLESTSGDFVIRRRDSLVAYQLAVVIDDALQGVTDIVRGIDLIESTPRQVYLQGLLDLPTPGYAHIPVAVDANGDKLSKATGADPVDPARPGPVLARALAALGQAPAAGLASADTATIWAWAAENWSPSRLAGRHDIAVQHYS